MTHEEIEELLGAFAVDAVDAQEARTISAHLSECPRCREEVDSLRETASMLARPAPEAPPGIWESISRSISQMQLSVAAPIRGSEPAGGKAAALRGGFGQRRRAAGYLLALAAAVAAIVVLSVQISALNSRVSTLSTALGRSGLSGAVAQAALAPHSSFELAGATPSDRAQMIETSGGVAYWVSSSLSVLPTSSTYQLWGLSHGHPVSLGLIGADPRQFASFRIEQGTTRVMVTVEPEGGSGAPTTPVLVSGTPSFVS